VSVGVATAKRPTYTRRFSAVRGIIRVVPSSASLRDPRRAGFVAGAVSASYCVCLFIGESLAFKFIFGLATSAFMVGIVLIAPLPTWKEAPERRRVAAVVMSVEAVVVAAILTVIRAVTR
jgi:hypothetical protein